MNNGHGHTAAAAGDVCHSAALLLPAAAMLLLSWSSCSCDQFSPFVMNLFFCDVTVRHRTFGSRRFERTRRAHFRCTTLQDDTTAQSRNLGSEISSDALSNRRRTRAPCLCVTHLLASVGIAGDVP